VKDQIKEIGIGDFDLSLGGMRIMNMSRILQVEKSMRVHGQLQPVVARVHEGGIQLIDGFKRVYACETLLLDRVQCRLLEVDEDQAKVLMLSYNWSTRSMEAYEEALVLQDLMATHGVDQRALAGQTGRSRSWVSRRLSLIGRLDEEIGTEIRMGTMSSSHGRALMRLPRGNQISVARVIRSHNLSSRQADRLVDAYLEAEDDKSQELILRCPERVLAKRVMWTPVERYYSELSSYGNDLLCGIDSVVESMQHLLRLLDDPRVYDLQSIEATIPTYGLELVTDGAACLTERISQIQTSKNDKEDERRTVGEPDRDPVS
jgi:ParB/RepB/Spo0J family partition protein